jgi:hypothetical protein
MCRSRSTAAAPSFWVGPGDPPVRGGTARWRSPPLGEGACGWWAGRGLYPIGGRRRTAERRDAICGA